MPMARTGYSSALQAAADLRTASATEAAAKERELAERETSVRYALALLDQAAKQG